jgi:hypothetical protein
MGVCSFRKRFERFILAIHGEIDVEAAKLIDVACGWEARADRLDRRIRRMRPHAAGRESLITLRHRAMRMVTRCQLAVAGVVECPGPAGR